MKKEVFLERLEALLQDIPEEEKDSVLKLVERIKAKM